MSYAVYEVEWKSRAPGQRIRQHIKAVSPEQAETLVRAKYSDTLEVIAVSVWRECTKLEIEMMEKP